MVDISIVLGVLIGGILTFASEMIVRKRDEKARMKLNMSVLYHDLKSIEQYFSKYHGNETDRVGIRFYHNWQSALSKCSKLNEDSIQFAYELYDSIYDLHYLDNNRPDSGGNSSEQHHNRSRVNHHRSSVSHHFTKTKLLIFNDEDDPNATLTEKYSNLVTSLKGPK